MIKRILIPIFIILTISIYCALVYKELYYLNHNGSSEIFSYITNELKDYNVEISTDGQINVSALETAHNTASTTLLTLLNSDTISDELVTKKIAELNTSIETNTTTLTGLTTTLATVKSEETTTVNSYKSAKAAYDAKIASYVISNVPTYDQYPTYPTGCESIALLILLKFYNVNVTAAEIVSALPKGSVPYSENGTLYGGNPYLEFVGNPASYSGYGAYEVPIKGVAETFKPGIINGTGKSLNDLFKIIRKGRPVLVWTSINLSTPYISTSWIYKPTNTKISWKAGEHAVVLIGYTATKVIISDPIDGTIKYQNKTTFENRYNYFGKRALYY